MNIALVILHADPARGGAERYTIDLARSLLSRGHHPTLLASTISPESAHGIDHILLDSGGLTRLGRYLSFLDALDAHLASKPDAYDIIHAMLPVRCCDIYHPHAGIAAESIASGHMKHFDPLARAFAQAATRMNLKRRRFALVERQLLQSSRPPLVLCLSNYIRSAVRRHYTIDDSRLFTLHNGVDLHRFDPAAAAPHRSRLRTELAIGPDQIVALMVAQDFARKGLAEAIEALAAVNDPRLVLLVVGRDRVEPYRKLAQRHGIEHQVIFAGPTDDPPAYYSAADFFILPTRHDPCSLVVLEALAMGLPVISTAQNGATEVMTDLEHGFILPNAQDVPALAASIRKMLDPDTRSRMGEACLSLRPSLSQESHVDRLLEAYELARRQPA